MILVISLCVKPPVPNGQVQNQTTTVETAHYPGLEDEEYEKLFESAPWLFKVYETEDKQRPYVPTDLMANEIKLHEVSLRRTAALNDRRVRFYSVYLNGVKKRDTEGTKLCLLELQQNTEYTLR